MSENFKYIYGPIVSKRLGLSLGVDIVPLKICNYNCLYCQLGTTKNKTIKRCEYIKIDLVLTELKSKLKECKPDYVSIVGSGEPALNNKLGLLITEIKKITSIPVAVITNGSLLHLKDVQNDLTNADLVIPSLDAGDDELFQKINRPHNDVSFNQMVQGIIDFKKNFNGRVWLEILFLKDINDNDKNVNDTINITNKINPDKIQISTISRPPAEQDIMPVSLEKLEYIKNLFNKKNVEIIYNTSLNNSDNNIPKKAQKNLILDLLKRHPSPKEDICRGLNLNINEVEKTLKEMIKENKIQIKNIYGKEFYIPAELN